MSWLITLPDERPQSLNKWLSGHWRVRDNEKGRIGLLVMFTAPPDIPRPFAVPVDVVVTAYFRNRPMDADNVPGKAYVDGLRLAGILSDDNPNCVASVTLVSKVDKDNPRVCIEIEEVE